MLSHKIWVESWKESKHGALLNLKKIRNLGFQYFEKILGDLVYT